MKNPTQFSNSSIQSVESQDGYDSDEDLTPARSFIPACLRSCVYGRGNRIKINRINSTFPSHNNNSSTQPLETTLVFQETKKNLPDIRPESSNDQGHEQPSEVEDLAFSDAQKIRLFNFFANQRNLRDHEINSRSPSPLIEEEDLTDEEKIRAFDFMASSTQNNMDENGLKRYLNLGDFSDDQLSIDFRRQDRNSSGSEASRPMSFFETTRRDSYTDNDLGAIIGSNIAISLDQEQFPITQNAQISEIIEDSLITPATPSSRIIRPTLPSVRLSQVANFPVEDGNFSNDLKIMAFDYINEVAQLGFNNLDNIGKIRRFNAATYVINTNKGMIKTAETFAGTIPN